MLYAALVSATLVAGMPGEVCSQPPRAVWEVAALHGAVAEDASLSLAEIEEMARQRGIASADPPLGFYTGTLAHYVSIRTDSHLRPRGGGCGDVTTVTVRLALLGRIVEVARELESDPCDYQAVLQHYRRHAAVDDAALSLSIVRLRHAFVKVWPDVERRLGASGKPDEAAIRRVVDPIVGRALDEAEQARLKAIAAVDSGREVERSMTCSRGSRRRT